MNRSIETFGLGKYFDSAHIFPDRKPVWAVRDVDISFQKGAVSCIAGPGGSGKSTFLRLLCTLMLPTEGNAFVNGYDIRRQGRLVRQSIGFFSSEEKSFYNWLSCRENLLFFASLYGLTGSRALRRISELAVLLDMDVYMDIPVNRLAKGLQRRLGLLRMMIHDPDIFIMDDPTAGLDTIISDNLRGFIKDELSLRMGKTVIYATSRIDELSGLADWVGFMVNGRFYISGSIDDIKSKTPVFVSDLDGAYIYWIKESEKDIKGDRDERSDQV